MKFSAPHIRLTRIVFLSCGILLYHFGISQTPGEWTWVHGTNTSSGAVFGTQGVPSDDVMPMSVYEGRSWVDLDGNFWMYGGLLIADFSGTSNYLWRYTPSTNQWTWMKGNEVSWAPAAVLGTQGVGDPANNPGGCDLGNSASWRDLNGDLWLLHGDAMLGNSVMWKYEIATNNWIWMSGNIPANYGTQGIPSTLNNPEIFYECPISWISDDGDLWFFDGYNGGVMWKYEIATAEWTWMNGVEDTGTGTPIVEGTQGVFDAANQPGSSWVYSSWKRNNNTFYMFGPIWNFNLGGDYRAAMWCFDPAINQWAWVGGVQSNSVSTFDGSCTFSPDNVPATNLEFTCSWTDECGLFWGYHELETYLWCYDPEINQFALVSGTTTAGDAVYGTQGVSSPTNDPGGAYATPHWTDLDGNLWKLGSIANFVQTNAMWRYVPDPDCIAGTGEPSLTNDEESGCAPLTIDFTSPTSDPDAVFAWDFGIIDSATDISSDPNPTFTFTEPGTYTVMLVVSGDVSSFCCSGDCDTLMVEIEVIAPIEMIFSNDTICIGETTTLEVSGATSYEWSPSTGLNTTTGSTVEANPTVTTEYIITGTTGGCSMDDTLTVVVNPLPLITVNSPTICENSSASLTANGAINYTWSPSATLDTNVGATVVASPSTTTTYTITGIDANTCSNTAQSTVTVEVVDISVNSGNYCAGDPANPLQLTASGASTYQWSPAMGLNNTTGNIVLASPVLTTTYQVVGTSANNCTDTTEAVVTVIPVFTVTVNSDSICSGTSLQLTAQGADTYGWSPANGLNTTTGNTVIASPSSTQVYTVTGNVSGCNETAISTVTVVPVPNAQIEVTPNPVLSSDPVVTFSTPNLEDSVLWYHEAELISQLHEFTQNLEQAFGTYEISLVVTNELGCPDSVSFTVIIQEDVVFYVPTAYTPNGDGVNDVFLPIITSGVDKGTYSLQIFDRWGEVIFNTTNLDQPWTGSVNEGGHFAQDGSYIWLIKFKQEFGAEWHEHTGHVVMVR